MMKRGNNNCDKEEKDMFRRTINITAVASLLIMVICLFAAGSIYADTGLKLEEKRIDVDKLKDTRECAIYLDESSDEWIVDAIVSKKGVVEISEVEKKYLAVDVVGVGDVVIRVTGSDGSIAEVPVHVGEKGFKKHLKLETSVEGLYYGEREVEVYTVSGAKVSLKIGKDKYAAKNAGESAVAKFKLRKMYDVKTKVRVSITKGGVTYTGTEKVINRSGVLWINAKGKTFSVYACNVHKGDSVEIKYAGRTYKKKFKKTCASKTLKIKAKAKIKKKAKVKVALKSKYNSTLMKYNLKLKKGNAQTSPYGW